MNAPEPTAGGMDDERCLFVLSLLMDGRAVDPELAAAARAHAAGHPDCARAVADWQAARAALAALPARTASSGFTARVLAAATAAGATTGASGASGASGELCAGDAAGLLVFARRLALAAGLVLAATLGWDLAHPGALRADSGLQRHRHVVDHFRTGPFAPDAIEDGLRARLADVEFGTPAGGDR